MLTVESAPPAVIASQVEIPTDDPLRPFRDLLTLLAQPETPEIRVALYAHLLVVSGILFDTLALMRRDQPGFRLASPSGGPGAGFAVDTLRRLDAEGL